jgi:hypothetical protein
VSGFAGLYRLTWSGTLGSLEDEIFSYTRHAGTVSTPDETTLANIADSAANDVTDFLAESTTGGVSFSTIAQAFPTTTQWDLLKVYIVDPATGDATSEPQIRVLTDAGTATGVPALTHQDALAITTQKLPRDKRSRNRFYLPTMISNVLDSTGHVRGTFIDDMQTQLKFSNTAHQAETDAWEYVVYSPTSHDFSAIDRYYSGDVMDTIRRRRNKLVESRHPLAA